MPLCVARGCVVPDTCKITLLIAMPNVSSWKHYINYYCYSIVC